MRRVRSCRKSFGHPATLSACVPGLDHCDAQWLLQHAQQLSLHSYPCSRAAELLGRSPEVYEALGVGVLEALSRARNISETRVMVLGASAAGLCAAISGKQGASVALREQKPHLLRHAQALCES